MPRLEVEADLHEGEELFGVVVGTDEGARVIWTPLFLNVPRDKRLQMGEFLKMSRRRCSTNRKGSTEP